LKNIAKLKMAVFLQKEKEFETKNFLKEHLEHRHMEILSTHQPCSSSGEKEADPPNDLCFTVKSDLDVALRDTRKKSQF